MTTGARTAPERTSSLIASPARARSPSPSQQALEVDPLGRELEPALKQHVVRKQLLQSRVDGRDVGLVPGERRPPERSDSTAEERSDIGRDEARVCERILYAGL